MSNTHGEWLDRIRGHKGKNKSAGEWNLGDGLPNVVNSIRQKLCYAGFQLEDRERTIINVDSYEVTVLVRALSEYTEQKTVKRVVSRGGITMWFSSACANTAPGAEGGL